MGEFCVVSTTTDSQSQARTLAAAIVQEGLGACVQIHAIESHYVWQGQQEQGGEFGFGHGVLLIQGDQCSLLCHTQPIQTSGADGVLCGCSLPYR